MDQGEIIKVQMMEQEVNQLNEQLKVVEQNVVELGSLNESLDELGKGKEILANLGKKIFVPVEIKDDKLMVDIGKDHMVKKSVGDTKVIVENQIGSLMDVKGHVMERLQGLEEEMNELIMKIQKEHMEEQVGKGVGDGSGHEGHGPSGDGSGHERHGHSHEHVHDSSGKKEEGIEELAGGSD
ncbi:prefoldin subunit alpha [Candidatus Pacearchaeota archaeon]|nr:prefoldin subunit alpha [Candidatus Pacearchaeota archaeon]|tara:strand:- start:6239 stop:6784 length:546 start_codon:yes stop_codon:yes gene_type:complete